MLGRLLLRLASHHHRVRKHVPDADSTTDEGTVIFLRGATPKAEHRV